MSSWDQANRGEKLGLVWRNRKKISQIINGYLYLLFFLLIILCLPILTIGKIYGVRLGCMHTAVHSQWELVPPEFCLFLSNLSLMYELFIGQTQILTDERGG
jgi:hypothetical protein